MQGTKPFFRWIRPAGGEKCCLRYEKAWLQVPWIAIPTGGHQCCLGEAQPAMNHQCQSARPAPLQQEEESVLSSSSARGMAILERQANAWHRYRAASFASCRR